MIPVSRTEAQTVACPNCYADPGQKCIGKRGLRESVHLERIQAFAQSLTVT